MKDPSRTRSDRTPHLSDADIELAEAHGLEPIGCPSCAGRGTGCPNCGGSGRLWHGASRITLDDTGLRRLASRDPAKDESSVRPRPKPTSEPG